MKIAKSEIITPMLHSVSEDDINNLLSIRPICSDLLQFWRENGAGDFNVRPDGSRFNETISNRLLDAEEMVDLIEGGDPEMLALLEIGVPFFNTLDRDYILIAQNGEIVELSTREQRHLICTNMEEFIDKLLQEPLFYEAR